MAALQRLTPPQQHALVFVLSEDAYQQVKERMHELDSNQHIDKLLELPSLQGQKPFDKLAKML